MSIDFYTIKTAAANEPILFADADLWSRDIDAADTALENALISAATDFVEKSMNRVFVSRVYTANFQCSSSSEYEPFPYIELRRSPLISVASVKVNTVALTLTDDYVIKNTSSFSRILFTSSLSLDTDLAYPIEVEFTAGYATVPEEVKTAIKQLVLFWYENRGDVSTNKKQSVPFVTRAIIDQYRIINTFG